MQQQHVSGKWVTRVLFGSAVFITLAGGTALLKQHGEINGSFEGTITVDGATSPLSVSLARTPDGFIRGRWKSAVGPIQEGVLEGEIGTWRHQLRVEVMKGLCLGHYTGSFVLRGQTIRGHLDGLAGCSHFHLRFQAVRQLAHLKS